MKKNEKFKNENLVKNTLKIPSNLLKKECFLAKKAKNRKIDKKVKKLKEDFFEKKSSFLFKIQKKVIHSHPKILYF